MTETITRDEFVALVDKASEKCAESTRAKLRAIAETTDAAAVGWFHCDGVQCPAMQARRRHQGFQAAYDHAMFARFGLDADETNAFVVEVVNA